MSEDQTVKSKRATFLPFALPDVDDQELLQIKEALDSGWVTNILKGEMSLVGPRPEDPRYVALYTPEQRRVLAVRPGITSAASLAYRHEEQFGATREEIRLALEAENIESRPLWQPMHPQSRCSASVRRLATQCLRRRSSMGCACRQARRCSRMTRSGWRQWCDRQQDRDAGLATCD